MLDRLARHMRPESVSVAALGLVTLGMFAAYLYVLKQPLTDYRGLMRHQAGASVGLRTGRDKPAAVALVGLQEELEGLRQRLVGVRPLAIGEVLMFDELPYEVEVTGSYMRLWDWLRDMEAELRPMVVNSYELERRTNATSVSLKLRLVAYRAREPRE